MCIYISTLSSEKVLALCFTLTAKASAVVKAQSLRPPERQQAYRHRLQQTTELERFRTFHMLFEDGVHAQESVVCGGQSGTKKTL